MTAPGYYDRVNPDVLRFLPPSAHVLLEFGCGTGRLGEEYKRLNPHCQYLAVEKDPTAATSARVRLDAVVCDDERADLSQLGMCRGDVDCLVYGDVLEHMSDPWTALREHAEWLSEHGQVIACIPNVQHWSMLLKLLRGDW